jgi:threonine/homoserine/homoserine lactone efflux protein
MSGTPAAASILAFAGVAAVFVLTPGVGTTFLMQTVVDHGRKAGYLTAIGMVMGASIHATIAAVGTAILLRRFPEALTWIAVGGGSFIALLGLRGIARAIRPSVSAFERARAEPRQGHSLVVTGALIALSNVPLPLFYFVVVPQYIPQGMSRVGGATLLSALHIMMAGAWMGTFVTLIGRIVDVLRRPAVLLVLRCATGLLLVLLGIRAVIGAV